MSLESSRRRTALITGATGFIGTALTARLAEAGWDVHGLVRDDGLPVPPALTAHRYEPTTEGIAAVIAEVAPDVVFHLASLFLGTHTPAQVEALVSANVLFGAQVLEGMTLAGVTRIVNTGTVGQHFGDADYDPISLYAATKQAFEDLLAYYAGDRGISAITLELFDTYGPDDPRPKLFSVLRRAAESGERLAMSPGEQRVDYVWIDDITAAYLTAAERLLADEVAGHERYEVRTGDARPLREIVETYERVTGRRVDVGWGERPYPARQIMKPWTGGAELPGWRATVALEEGIRRMEGIA